MRKRGTRTAAVAIAALMVAWPLPAAVAKEPQPGALTLEKAIELAGQNNPALKAGAEELRAADARVTQSRSGWFPQITATAGYTRLDPVSEMSFGGLGMIKFMPNDNYDTKVTARGTLLDFGTRGKTVDLALSGKKAAEHSLQLSHRELSWQTVQLFYGILFLHESIKVEAEEITALNKALDFATKRYQAGSATRFDRLSAEVRIAAAQRRMLDLQHELLRNEVTLRRLTGLKDHEPIALQGSFGITPTSPSESGAREQAQQQRLELKLSRESETAASVRRALAMKKGLPVVTGSVSWGVMNGFQPNIDAMRGNLAAGVHLELPLFTGFRTSGEQQEATALLRAATLRRVDAEEQATADVEEILHGLGTASEKIKTTDAEVKQARLAAEHARARYENGMATTLDLLNTEASLSQAELAQLQAKYEYIMNSYTLKRVTGEVFW